MSPVGEAAEALVGAVYKALDLFGGDETALLGWAKNLESDAGVAGLAPVYFAPASVGALARALTACGVARHDATIDRVRMLQFQEACELLPHFRLRERVRVVAPPPKVMFTVPPSVQLDRADTHVQRSLASRLNTLLGDSDGRTLIAAPYWSTKGTDLLWDGTARARELEHRVVLAGARAESSGHDHLLEMRRFGHRLQAAGAQVRCLEWVDADPSSIFHAKLVCTEQGYLGSGNFTHAAMATHFEAGTVLTSAEVDRVWWVIERLEKTGVLREVKPTP
jgi:hypothetical protein